MLTSNIYIGLRAVDSFHNSGATSNLAVLHFSLPPSAGNGLGVGAIVGIVLGALMVVGAVVGGVVFTLKKKNKTNAVGSQSSDA